MRRMEEEHGVKLMEGMTCILMGGLVGAVCCFLLLFLCSVGISLCVLPYTAMYQFTIISCVLGCLVGGTVAVRRYGGKTLVMGLGVSGVFFLLLLTASVLFFDGMNFATGGIGILIAALCGGGGAGLLGGTKKKKRRR